MTDRGAGEGDADLERRLVVCREAVEQLSAERDGLERLLLRIPGLYAEADPVALRRGVLEAAVEVARARFGFYLPVEPHHELSELVGIRTEDFGVLPSPGHSPLLGAVLSGGRVLRIDDVTRWAGDKQAVHTFGTLADGRLLRSWLAAPVRRRDHSVAGALYLGNPRPQAFLPRHENLVGALADQLGITLDNAELLEERSQVAAVMQRTLLPPLMPNIPGVDVAAVYRPAGANSLVGGDFYDVFDLGEGTWGVVLGDVSGFGPEAAALTGLARYTIRAVATQNDSPAEVLSQLNDAMCRYEPSDRFCTAVYARLCPVDGGLEITLASGGHPPALVLRDDETVEEQPVGGLMIGVFPEVDLEDRSVTLRPGDSMALYTDGAIEARDRTGDQFGLTRLSRLLATCTGRSAAGVARRLELAVLDHRGEQSVDDLAIVVLRARP